MELKTIKAIITDDLYIPINRKVKLKWVAGDTDNCHLDDGEMQGTIKNTELIKHFKEIGLPSREQILETLTDHFTRSVTGELIRHNELDKHGAPAWSMVYKMTPLAA